MELVTVVFGSAGKRRRSTEEKPGDGNRTMKENKKAKAQITEVQEEIVGGVDASEECERERGESEKRDGMEYDEVVSGEASGGGTGGGGRASGLGRDGQIGGGGKSGGLMSDVV
jgi:hypothetical protein